jgi:hypothetical protein
MAYETFGLRIDGALIPPPSGYTYTEADIVANSFRNSAGYASWDVVRQNVANISLTWEKLNGTRLRQVIAAIRGKKQFEVTCFNPMTGNMETHTFYSGDRAAELARFVSASHYWATLTVPFVEV